jgi:hypothetical protein
VIGLLQIQESDRKIPLRGCRWRIAHGSRRSFNGTMGMAKVYDAERTCDLEVKGLVEGPTPQECNLPLATDLRKR